MKILKYKSFMIKEEIINMNTDTAEEDSIEQVRQAMTRNIQQIKDFEESYGKLEDDEIEEFLESLEEQPLPKVLKDYIMATIQLMSKKEFIDFYKKYLNIIMVKANNYKSAKELFDDQEIKALGPQLMVLMSKILNKPVDEITELTNKMLGGAKEYHKSAEDAKKITEDDPYGEEVWDNMSDRERLYKAYGEEKPDEIDDL